MEEVKSVEADLAARLEEADATAGTEGTAPEVEVAPVSEEGKPAADTSTEGRTRGADGRFLAGKEAKPEAQAQANTEAQTDPKPLATDPAAEQQAAPLEQVDLPPSTFTVAGKSAYAGLPKDSALRADIKKREADFQKGIGQYKQMAETGSRLLNEIQPYMAQIRAEGGSPETAVRTLFNTAYMLRQGSPQERGRLVMQIAQQYGADISPWMGQGQQAQGSEQGQVPIQQVVQQLMQPYVQRIDQFTTQQQSAQQRMQQEQDNRTSQQIEAFRSATDDKGQAKHVYFDNVRGVMGSLISNGDAQSLEQAYEMACRAHPEVSKAMSAEQRTRDEAQRLEEARRKAEGAKRANAANVSGQGGVGIADTSKLSLHDDIAARLDGTARL